MMERRPFGVMPDGTPVELVALRSGELSCEIITYGGAVRSFTVPDRTGRGVDVVLGFDTLEDYRRQDKYVGAIVGRYANRIGGARFAIDGIDYPLAANNGANHLHGGIVGFDKQVWRVEATGESSVTLGLTSPDGQEGYPGTLEIRARYTLTPKGLVLNFEAESTEDTVCNLTNHTYFNLSGHDSGPVGEQVAQLPGGFYTPTDAGSIPTGEILSVEGTPMDLRRGLPIARRIDEDFPQLRLAGGYDHNWVVPGPVGTLRLAGRAWSPKTGVTLEVLTTLPGVQFYTANYLDGCPAGKGGARYGKRWGFCMETQFFPDSPNCPHFPSPLLRAGEVFRQTTVYRLGAVNENL